MDDSDTMITFSTDLVCHMNVALHVCCVFSQEQRAFTKHPVMVNLVTKLKLARLIISNTFSSVSAPHHTNINAPQGRIR